MAAAAKTAAPRIGPRPLMSPAAGVPVDPEPIDPLVAAGLLSGGAGALLAEDRGHPLLDRLRGFLKGTATGSGAALAASLATGEGNPGLHTMAAGLGGGVASHLAAGRLLAMLGIDRPRSVLDDEDESTLPGPGFGKAAHPALARLIEAKTHSDARRYSNKHMILRELLRQAPQDFLIDSEERGILGLTHRPTRFRIHMPGVYLPSGVTLDRLPPPAAPVKEAALVALLRVAEGRP